VAGWVKIVYKTGIKNGYLFTTELAEHKEKHPNNFYDPL
jgi:hypothetical protein